MARTPKSTNPESKPEDQSVQAELDCSGPERDVAAEVDNLNQKLDKVVDSTNQALAESSEQTQDAIADLKTSLAKEIALALQGFQGARPEVESDAHLPAGGVVDDKMLDDNVIESTGNHDLNSPEFKTKMEIEAFMKEPCTVLVHQLGGVGDRSDPYVVVSVEGHKVRFELNQEKIVPRYIVECLARAKPVNYGNEEYVRNDGVRAYRWPTTISTRYPFSVISDSPCGNAWLQRVLRQP